MIIRTITKLMIAINRNLEAHIRGKYGQHSLPHCNELTDHFSIYLSNSAMLCSYMLNHLFLGCASIYVFAASYFIAIETRECVN